MYFEYTLPTADIVLVSIDNTPADAPEYSHSIEYMEVEHYRLQSGSFSSGTSTALVPLPNFPNSDEVYTSTWYLDNSG